MVEFPVIRSTMLVVGGLLALGAAAGARADTDAPRCAALFDSLVGNEVFDRYPARIPAGTSKPVAPDVGRGQAHLYRTVIREAAGKGPNFAGHYTLIRIGCGAATVCPAIVDARTGKVFFPPELVSAEALLVDTGDTGVETLNYRKDSRLIIVVGTPNENLKNEGMSYYLWWSGKLTRIRFVPKAKLCAEGSSVTNVR